ncbi:N-acetylglucosamine-6-phosphate deacetylase [Paenibacillus agaridevorans]|nr:N-acetylglucosamine-6-phosphate deacetylase [Paenibacillus agaridevorans]
MSTNPAVMTVVNNGTIVMDNNTIKAGTIAWQDERIVYIGSREGAAEIIASKGTYVEEIDAHGGWVLPGFIDVHVHGGYGHDFMDATWEAYDAITQFHGQRGTTTMLATTVTASHDAIGKVIRAVAAYQNGEMPYARLLGVHLEGPFISLRWSGAQDPKHIVAPKMEWLEKWVSDYPGLIRILTLAPEIEGATALITWLKDQKIVSACGHTDATYECINEAADYGLTHAVHTFNAMRGFHHRNPGTVGAVLSHNGISAEIIADGHHVHPVCIRLLTKLKRSDQVILITDAISAAGLSDGSYHIAGLDVNVQNGISRLKEGGNLSGSTLTMIEAFRYMVQEVGLTIAQVSRFASGNPAKLLGLESELGSLAYGKKANVLLLSPDLELQVVWVHGRSINEAI